MKILTLLLFLLSLTLPVGCNEELGPITDTPVDNVIEYSALDNEFLAAMFKQRFSENEYAIVSHASYMRDYSKNIISDVNWLDSKFKNRDCEIRDMIEAFYEKNTKPTKLTLKSSKKDGYVFDDAVKLDKLRLFGTKGFRKLKEKFPNLEGSVRVSLPVIGKNGLVLIYYEFFNSNGVDRYELHKFKNNQLIYLTSILSFTAD